MKKIIYTALMLLTTSIGGFAQTDFGLWAEAGVDFSITKRWDIGIDGELRTQDGFSSLERWTLGLSTDVSLAKILSIGGGYTFIDTHRDESTTAKGNLVDEYWRIKHRIYGHLKFKFKPSILRISLRERYQFTRAKEVNIKKYSSAGVRKANETKEEEDENLLRSKLEIDFKTKTILTPFVSYELFNNLGDSFSLKKHRLEVGTQIKLNKHNALEVSYKHNWYDNDDDDKTHNVLGVAYKFKL